MSILSRFKGSKKASTRQPESKAGPRKPEPVPYRHVPTHAAADAMSGSSSGCKGEAKSAIKDAHKKRMSRPTSSVSLSMYATNNRLLRNYSQTTTTTQCSSTKPIQVHLGYMGYDGFEESVTTSKTRSLPAKSPLSSNARTPMNSQSTISRPTVSSDSSTSTDLLEISYNKSPLTTVTAIQLSPTTNTTHSPTIKTTTTTTMRMKTPKAASPTANPPKSKRKRPAPIPIQNAKSPLPPPQAEQQQKKKSRLRDGIFGRIPKQSTSYY